MEHRDRNKATELRRVPPNLRRRAEISCDRCKKRRIRCIRPGGSEQEQACQSCVETHSQCESTLPRKNRIYGSVELLSTRYRLLDALVKKLYPDVDTEKVNALQSILESQNINIAALVNHGYTEDLFYRNSTPASSPSRSLSDTPPTSTPKGQRSANSVSEERLIPTPHGQSHYIGPSSSFGFVITIRNLVAEVNAASRATRSDDERTQLRSDFATLHTSKALEPHSPDERDGCSDGLAQPDIEEEVVANQTQRGGKQQPFRREVPINSFLLSRSWNDPTMVFMPVRELADGLVEAYFDQVHPNYLLFHRGIFQSRYEYIFHHGKKPLRDIDMGWICCLFMVFVLGAQALEHHDQLQSIQLQRHYLALVKSRLAQVISTTSLSNVQALLLFQLHQHNASERNSAWMLLGCASRMAMALGMHREGATGGFDAIEREVRRRVWWTMYLFEQNLCVVLGRPSAIDEFESKVGLPNETMLNSGEVPSGYLDNVIRLTRISARVKRQIYATPIDPSQQTGPVQLTMTKQLISSLESWYRNLPPHLRLDGLSLLPKYRRTVLLLHIQYHHSQTLVTRPFLLRKAVVQVADRLQKQERPADLDSNELSLSHSCCNHAKEVVILLCQLARSGMLDGVSWVDVYYFYHGVLILSVDLLARPQDQPDTPEDMSRKLAVREAVSAVRSTQLCPTFAILTQVALQLAKIVGIFDDVTADAEGQSSPVEAWSRPVTEHQMIAQGEVGSHENIDDIMSQMFQYDTFQLPWDFFSVNDYGGNENNSFDDREMPIAGTFTLGLEESPSSIVLPANEYPTWGSVDNTVLRQNFAGPGSQ